MAAILSLGAIAISLGGGVKYTIDESENVDGDDVLILYRCVMGGLLLYDIAESRSVIYHTMKAILCPPPSPLPP